MHHFKAPHDMFQNARRYDTYLEDVEIPEPANLFDPPDGSAGSRGFGSGVGRTHAPWKLANRLGVPTELDDRAYAKKGYQRYLRRYLRCVKGVDDNVRRLLDYLEEEGELDNTMIFYTGDQGFFLGEHDLMDKRWMYEEAFRMPLIVHWPDKLKAGAVNDWLINNTDFAPTILVLAGRPAPKYMHGRSFAAALAGQPKPSDWRKVTYYRYWMHMAHRLAVPGHFGIRSDRHKLIFFYGASTDDKLIFFYGASPDGRVDTPPTLAGGLRLLGTRSGTVYALRAKDGQLAWRLRVAPEDERIVAFGHLESLWPTAGSVLVVGDTVFVAGKKGQVLAFDAANGKRLAERDLPPVVWDGMAAAHGILYVSTADGKVMALGRE
jgi:hypothetical protein